MFELRPVSPTTQREETTDQEAQEDRAGALDLLFGWFINTLFK